MSCATVSTLSLPVLSAANLSSIGSSAMQGAHQVAQRLTSTGLPLNEASASCLPDWSVSVKSGIALPLCVRSSVPVRCPGLAAPSAEALGEGCGCAFSPLCLLQPASATAS